MRALRWTLPLALGLAGCTGPEDVPTTRIETDWTRTLERLGLFAVYPPNEDVMVGDVFLAMDPAARPATADSRFAATRLVVPPCDALMDALSEQGRNRPRIEAYQPPTAPKPEAPAATPSAAPAPMPGTRTATTTIDARGLTATATFAVPATPAAPRAAAPRRAAEPPAPPPPGPRGTLGRQADHCGTDDDGTAFEIGDARSRSRWPAIRLMQTDTPILDVARVRQFSGGIAGAYEGIAATLGLQSRGSVSLTLRLTNLQNLTLNEVAAHRLLRSIILQEYRDLVGPRSSTGLSPPEIKTRVLFSPTDLLRSLYQSWDNHPLLVRQVCTSDFTALRRNNVRIVIANRVLYANGIDYAFTENSAFGARAAASVDPAALVPGATVTPRPPTLPALAPVDAPTDVASLQTAVSQLNAALAGATAAAPTGLLGANLSFGVGSSGRFTIRQNYDRPMAVGFGSALSYWIENALLPVNSGEIEEFTGYCREIGGVPVEAQAAVRFRLQNNLIWLQEAAAGRYRDSGNSPVMPARNTPPSLGRARTF